MNTVVVSFGLKQQPDDEYVREEDASASSSQVFRMKSQGLVLRIWGLGLRV